MAVNMYFDYRNRASKDNAALKSRERAAEILGISESSLSNYETGKTKCVPAEMVDQMAAIYNAPELRNIYCMTACPIGTHKHLATDESSIEKIAVHLINCTEPTMMTANIGKFIKIAADGIIDDAEKPVFKEIAEALKQVSFAISEFNILAERQGALWN